MKITMSTADFKDAVSKVVLAAPAKAQTPILNGMFIHTADKPQPSAILECNDFSTCIKARIPAEITDAGSCVLPAVLLAKITPKLQGGLVELETLDHKAVIKSDSAKFELYTMNPEEFPTVNPNIEVDGRFKCSIKDFKTTIRRTVFAAAKNDDSRPIFKSVQLVLQGDKLTAVSTNTHRLAVAADVELLEHPADNANLLVPDNVLNNVLSMLPDDKGKILCEYYANQLCFYFDNIRIYARLIDGVFPPHEKIIPTEITVTANVDIKALKSALERANLISNITEYHTVTFKFGEGGLNLIADSVNAGKFDEHIDAVVSGELSIAFNIDYLLDFLKAVGGNRLNVGATEALSPAKFTVDGDEDFVYIVTPVRTR